MPGHEIPLRVGSSSVKLVKDMVEYPLDIDTAGFTRTGEDGALKMLSLFGGDEMVGEVLEGHWVKGWDSGMDAAQAFTAILDGSGVLEFEGEADVAGTWGYGWIDSQLPLPLLDENEVTVAMSVPVDVTGGPADRDLLLDFYLRQDKDAASPRNDDNYIRIWADIDESGIIFYITKEVGGTITTLFSGSTYDDASGRATGDLEATIWRLVFDGKPGTSGAQMHIYLKQSDTLANAEDADEHELTTSPYDLSNLQFHIAYSAFRIGSQNTTYFDSGNEAKVGYVRVTYPYFETHPVNAEADLNLGLVELWDGDPDSGGIRVYDEDHVFSGDPYIQNGLLRLHINEATQYGILLYLYYGGAWNRFLNHYFYYLRISLKYCEYPQFLNIVYISSEKIVVKIRLTDTATKDEDYYVDIVLTIERGKYYFILAPTCIYPNQVTYFSAYNTPVNRFGYVGNCEIGDNDLTISGINATLTDNFAESFDDAGDAWVVFLGISKKPDDAPKRFLADTGGHLYMQDYVGSTLITTKLFIGATPFALVANLFEEAEDGSYGAAGTVTDAAASPSAGANNAVQLNAIGDYTVPNGEYSAYTFTAGTHLPAGRYLAAIRARYVDIETMEMYVYNSSDSVYRNEKNAKVTKTLAATFGYHCVVFDITDADVTGTDAFAVVAEKTTNDATEIRTDYMLIIPIGDGESWPQDLAHSALRDIVNARRVYQK